MLDCLTVTDRVKVLKMKDHKGLTPAHHMIFQKSMSALQGIPSPMRHDERLNALQSGNPELHSEVGHFFKWLAEQRESYPLLVPPERPTPLLQSHR